VIRLYSATMADYPRYAIYYAPAPGSGLIALARTARLRRLHGGYLRDPRHAARSADSGSMPRDRQSPPVKGRSEQLRAKAIKAAAGAGIIDRVARIVAMVAE